MKALEEMHQNSEFSSPRSVQGDQAISSPLLLSFEDSKGLVRTLYHLSGV